MASISHKSSLVIGTIVVAVLVISVGYYELYKPPVHYGFISMSRASSILNANYTVQLNDSSNTTSQTPFPGAQSFKMVNYYGQVTQYDIFISEGYFSNSSTANAWYDKHSTGGVFASNGVKLNQSYDGFTVSYLDANLTSPHMYEAIEVCAVNGHYVLSIIGPGAVLVTSSAEIPNFVHAQLNAMA